MRHSPVTGADLAQASVTTSNPYCSADVSNNRQHSSVELAKKDELENSSIGSAGGVARISAGAWVGLFSYSHVVQNHPLSRCRARHRTHTVKKQKQEEKGFPHDT